MQIRRAVASLFWPQLCQFRWPCQSTPKTRTKSPRPRSKLAITLRTSVCSATNGNPSSFRTSAARRMSFSPYTFSPLPVVERNNFRRSRLDSLPVRSITNETAVFGVSMDSPAANAAFAKQIDVKFPLLSDMNKKMLNDYGILKGYDVKSENTSGRSGRTSSSTKRESSNMSNLTTAPSIPTTRWTSAPTCTKSSRPNEVILIAAVSRYRNMNDL